MKNNKKLLSVVCVMLMVSVIGLVLVSGTYAKYVTETGFSDTARVARWGFSNVDLTEVTLFADTYDEGAVDSSNTDNVIAPGTTKTATLTITPESSSAPEVAYSFLPEIGITDIAGNELEEDAEILEKLEFQLDNGDFTDFATFQEAFEALGEAYVPANTLPTNGAGSHTITWRWVYELTEGGDVTSADVTAWDESDTAMGNAETLADLKLQVSITATQLDTIPTETD